jgi:hypothetical protein
MHNYIYILNHFGFVGNKLNAVALRNHDDVFEALQTRNTHCVQSVTKPNRENFIVVENNWKVFNDWPLHDLDDNYHTE